VWIALGVLVSKILAVAGFAGAVVFAVMVAFTDTTTAATIAAVGTVLASLVGVVNTWLQAKTLRRTEAVGRRIGAVHETARDSATVIREITGTERRKRDRKDENQ
jgi:uncharacterized membrane protein YccC